MWKINVALNDRLRAAYDSGSTAVNKRLAVVESLRDALNAGATLHLVHNRVLLPTVSLQPKFQSVFDGVSYEMTEHPANIVQDFPKDTGTWSAEIRAGNFRMSIAPADFAASVTISTDLKAGDKTIRVRIYAPLSVAGEVKPPAPPPPPPPPAPPPPTPPPPGPPPP